MTHEQKLRRYLKTLRFQHIKSHVFAGRRYKTVFRKVNSTKDFRGLCDPWNKKGKTITVATNQSDLNLLKTVIDEGIHACFWPLENVEVDKCSEAIGNLLNRMGFYFKKEPKKRIDKKEKTR